MKTRPNSARGSTLFVVLFFMALLSIFVGAAFSLTSNTANIGNRSTQMTMAYAVADGAMELVYSRWRSVVSFSTNKNLNARVFIEPSSVYNSESKDITQVTLADLGLPAGYLGLSNTTTDTLATVTLQTVDASGRLYGNYDSNGRCTDSDTRLVEGARRTAYDASTNAFYPPPPVGADYTFRVASANANGFQSLEMIYRVEVAVTVQTRTVPLVAKVRRHFTRSVANAAQAAYFYEDRLEIIPGTNTTIKGRVHTNKDLWIGDRTDVLLQFLNNVTFVEGATPVYKTNPVGAGGVPGFDDDTSLPFAAGTQPTNVAPMTVGGVNRESLKPFNDNLASRGEYNPSYNNNSLREIIEPPTTRGTDAYADASALGYDEYWNTNQSTNGDQRAIEQARLYQQADIKIILAYNPDGTLNLSKTIVRGKTSADRADGVDAAAAASGSLPGALGYIKEALVGGGTPILTGTSRVTIEDRREASGTDTVKVTRVNLARLKELIETHFFDAGAPRYGYTGVVYISDNTYGDPGASTYNPFSYGTGSGTLETNVAGGVVKHGLLLENGYSLPGSDATAAADRNFTIATQNGVYIKGDYNIGGTPADPAQPPSNATGASAEASTIALKPDGTPYNIVTSSIMADAITVVSNRFDPATAGLPVATIRTADGTPTGAPVLNADGTPQLARGAVSTTINTAIVTGQYQSNESGYSGGSTNIIRFLENWTQPTTAYDAGMGTVYSGGSTQNNFTYKGSIMQSYTSKEFSNKFLSPSAFGIYSPPQRRVIFDENFLATPPVGFPGTITYTKGPWERPTT